MSDRWPPAGYSTPEEYERSENLAIGIALIVALGVAAVITESVQTAAGNLIDVWTRFAESLELGLFFLYVGAHLAWVGWIIVLSILTLGAHEATHYGIARLLGLDPNFEWDDFVILKNPSVVIETQGIKRWENLAMLSAPLVIIGAICLVIMGSTGGVMRGSAAFVLLINSAGAGLDIYHILRILVMPTGTQYANFRKEGKLYTEYSIPEK